MYSGCNHRGDWCKRAWENVSCNFCDGRQNMPSIGWDRIKVSENLGATMVTIVTPMHGYIPGRHNRSLRLFTKY